MQVGETIQTRLIFFSTVIIVAIVMSFPFFWLVNLTFKTNTQLLIQPFTIPNFNYWGNYKHVFEIVNFRRIFTNTFIISICSISVGTLITVLSSFVVSRFRFKWTAFLYFFLLMGLAIPIYTLMLPIFEITNYLGLNDTYLSLILPYIAGQISFNTLLFVGFLREFPREIEDAAVMDGCGLISLLARITLPIIKPAIFTVLIFQFLGTYNEFPLAAILINSPKMATIALTSSLFKGQYTVDYAGMATVVLLLLLPQLVIYVLFQRQISEGMTAGAVKS